MFKGLLWVVMILTAWGIMAPKARAESDERLNALVADKKVIYAGTCTLGKKGELVFTKEEAKVVVECAVGIQVPNTDEHYVLLFKDGDPMRLVLFKTKDKSQKRLWRLGSSV